MLGAVLLEGAPALARVAPKLRESDFYTDHHRIIYAAVLAMDVAGEPVDLITLAEELRRREQLHQVGGKATLAQLAEEASIAAHLDRYVAIVRDKAILRDLIQQATSVITDAYDDRRDVRLVVDGARETFERIAAQSVVAEARFKALRLDALRALDLPKPPFLIEDWLPGELLSFVVGDSEAMKSWTSSYMGFCVAAGVPLFGRWPVHQAPVLIISEENGLTEDKARADLIYRGMGLATDEIPLYIASDTSFSFDDPVTYAAMRAFVQEHGIRLIVIDSFVRVHRRKEQDAGEMNALYLDRVKPLLRDGVAIVALHHKRKLPAGSHASAASDNDDVRGSGDIRAAASAILFLRRVGEKKDKKVVLSHNKTRGFDMQEPFVFQLAGSRKEGRADFVFVGKPEDVLDRSEACRLAILDFMQGRGTATRQAIEAHLKGKFSKKVFDPVLKKMSADGYPLKKDKVGREVLYHFVSGDPDQAAPETGGDDDVPF